MRRKLAEILIVSMVLFALACLACSCQQKQRWGQGDPPQNWMDYFGNDNKSRVDYVQTKTVNKIGQTVAELAERVRKLEEPPDPNKTEWMRTYNPDVVYGLRADGVMVWYKANAGKDKKD